MFIIIPKPHVFNEIRIQLKMFGWGIVFRRRNVIWKIFSLSEDF